MQSRCCQILSLQALFCVVVFIFGRIQTSELYASIGLFMLLMWELSFVHIFLEELEA
jgi:hypothetical protein